MLAAPWALPRGKGSLGGAGGWGRRQGPGGVCGQLTVCEQALGHRQGLGTKGTDQDGAHARWSLHGPCLAICSGKESWWRVPAPLRAWLPAPQAPSGSERSSGVSLVAGLLPPGSSNLRLLLRRRESRAGSAQWRSGSRDCAALQRQHRVAPHAAAPRLHHAWSCFSFVEKGLRSQWRIPCRLSSSSGRVAGPRPPLLPFALSGAEEGLTRRPSAAAVKTSSYREESVMGRGDLEGAKLAATCHLRGLPQSKESPHEVSEAD